MTFAERLRALMGAPPRPLDYDERPDVAANVVQARKQLISEVEINLPQAGSREEVTCTGHSS
jgi:hypothetical protein